jgi:hypothetical protein
MKLPKYKEVLAMGKEKVNKTLAPIKAARAEKQAELEMAKLDEKIATQEAAIHEECCSNRVDFSKIIDMQDTLALAERRKKQYQKILDEMF